MFKMPGKFQRAGMRIKWPLFDLIHKIGLEKKMLKMRSGNIILVYHGIDKTGNTKWNSRFISEENFEIQLKWFRDHCRVLTLDQFWRREFTPDRLNICLTFDDGYENNFQLALPLLEKYGLPATFFITPIREMGFELLWPDLIDLASPFINQKIMVRGNTYIINRKGILVNESNSISLKQMARDSDWEFVNAMMIALMPFADFMENSEMDDYWKMMSNEQIKKLANTPGMTIGSHGMTHCSLGKIKMENADNELKQSKQILGNITGKLIDALAFPDGNYSQPLIGIAEKEGYKYQLASEFFYQEDYEDGRLRERFGMNPHISWKNQQYALLRGTYY